MLYLAAAKRFIRKQITAVEDLDLYTQDLKQVQKNHAFWRGKRRKSFWDNRLIFVFVVCVIISENEIIDIRQIRHLRSYSEKHDIHLLIIFNSTSIFYL